MVARLALDAACSAVAIAGQGDLVARDGITGSRSQGSELQRVCRTDRPRPVGTTNELARVGQYGKPFEARNIESLPYQKSDADLASVDIDGLIEAVQQRLKTPLPEPV